MGGKEVFMSIAQTVKIVGRDVSAEKMHSYNGLRGRTSRKRHIVAEN